MIFRSLQIFLLTLSTLVALNGCGVISAQNPSGPYSPVNAVEEGSDSRVMLEGADVVAYFVDSRYRQGSPKFTSQYDEITFRFTSAEHKALFDKDPTAYLPQFGGYCTNGIAYGIPWGGDADMWKIIDGRLYIFGGQASKDAFELDERTNLALAEAYWQDEVEGSNSFFQRTKRLIFRVPHYQSGNELAEAVAKSKARMR